MFNNTSNNDDVSTDSYKDNNNNNCSERFVVSTSCALFDFTVYTLVAGSLCAAGMLGNIVSFVVLLRDRGRSATCLLLRALAVADTLVLVVAVPLYVLPPVYPYTGYLKDYNEQYARVMPVLWPLFLIPYTSTVFITVLVSMHRYCAVCRPFRVASKVYTCKEAQQRILIIILISVIYNIPRFFEYHSVSSCFVQTENGAEGIGGENKKTELAVYFELSKFGQNRLYRIVYANVLYFVIIHGGPLLLIGFFNVRLIAALKRRQKRRVEMGKDWYQQDISVVLVVVMCVFLVCQTPTFVDHVLWTVIDDRYRQCGGWHYYYTALSDTLAILNSAVNFVIYALTSQNFRVGLTMNTVCSSGHGPGRWGAETTVGRSECIAMGQCSRLVITAPNAATTTTTPKTTNNTRRVYVPVTAVVTAVTVTVMVTATNVIRSTATETVANVATTSSAVSSPGGLSDGATNKMSRYILTSVDNDTSSRHLLTVDVRSDKVDRESCSKSFECE